jgi:hypothetical protein
MTTSPSLKLPITARVWFAIWVPALIGVTFGALAVLAAEKYGLALFLALPAAIAYLATWWSGLHTKRTFAQSYGISVLSILATGVLVLLFAIDGIICLLMAFPLAVLIASIGVALARMTLKYREQKISRHSPLIIIALMPCLVGFEYAVDAKPPLRQIVSQVLIPHTTKERVWDSVVAFSEIKEPPTGLFRLGIAYPKVATIEGTGVGAIRYCTFSTGSFVEPITEWKPGERLAFTVKESPPPMEEFSLYEHVEPAHLHGYMASERGQFQLIPKANGILLEGTTWYRHDMWPQWYWGPITDVIIHQIHERVLGHIRKEAMQQDTAPAH